MRTFQFLLLLAFCGNFSFGQSAAASITHQNIYWLRYYNQLTINPKWVWHNEIEMRRFMDNNRLHHVIGHTHIHHKILPNLDIALGLTYSEQSPHFSDTISTLVVPEIRSSQEITHNQQMGKRIDVSHRVRLEERFFHKNDGIILLDGTDFNYRFRYRLQLNINLSKLDSKTPTNLKVADEIFLNFGEEILYNRFDQNRVTLGVEKVFSKNLSLEMGYIQWFQQRNSGKDFFDRNILRLTILHKIKL